MTTLVAADAVEPTTSTAITMAKGVAFLLMGATRLVRDEALRQRSMRSSRIPSEIASCGRFGGCRFSAALLGFHDSSQRLARERSARRLVEIATEPPNGVGEVPVEIEGKDAQIERGLRRACAARKAFSQIEKRGARRCDSAGSPLGVGLLEKRDGIVDRLGAHLCGLLDRDCDSRGAGSRR